MCWCYCPGFDKYIMVRKALSLGQTRWRRYGNCLYYLFTLSVSFKLSQNVYLEEIGERKEIRQKLENGSDWLRVLCSSLGWAALCRSPCVWGYESRGLRERALLFFCHLREFMWPVVVTQLFPALKFSRLSSSLEERMWMISRD